MTQNQQVATRPQQGQQQVSLAKQTANYVEAMTAQWAKVLPTVCTPERFARVALSCLNGNPKLAQALSTPKGKISLSQAFMKCAEVGLEPNGRDAHLIPYKDDIQLILDYKGIVKLCRRSGEIANIIAEAVHEKDEFSYEDGVVHHKIDFRLADRGPTYAWYVKVVFKDGTIQTKVMGKADVEAIRSRSRAKDSGPWVTDYDAMALKSTFKQLSKWLPMAYEPLDKAIQYDNEDERGPIDVTPKPSRFDATAQAPSGGLLGALAGEQPVGQNAEMQNVPQNQPAAPQDADAALNQALAEKQAPVGYNQIREWYETENGKWDPADVLVNLGTCINRTLDYVESANQQ
jgi:recombination protein RecT